MPHATANDGARIHYELHGSGDPVLLIMGLGSNAYGWARTLPWLSEAHQAIAFDNRGVGRSDAPKGAYTISQMAADAAAVLDAMRRRRRHRHAADRIALRGGVVAGCRVRSLRRVRRVRRVHPHLPGVSRFGWISTGVIPSAARDLVLRPPDTGSLAAPGTTNLFDNKVV